MIIQGTNNPLIFTFSEPMTTISDIEISLYTENKENNTHKEWKHWTLDDVEIERPSVAVVRKDERKKCEIEDLYRNVKVMRDTAIEVPKIIE